MAVPYTFGSATAAIPLSQLDSNFATAITLGNTAIQLGNTVTTLNNMTLANVTVSSGNVTVTSVTDSGLTAGRVNYNGTGGLLVDSANLTFDGTNLGLAGGTANGVAYLNGSKVLTTGSALVFDGANLGVGVTPSAWGTGASVKGFQLPGVSLWGYGNTNAYLSANAYYNGTNRIYTTSAYASEYAQSGGTHIWFNAPSGTAGNAISFTQAMTLDASGNLGVGTTSPAVSGINTTINVKSPNSSGSAYLLAQSSDGGSSIGLLSGNSSSDQAAIIYQTALRFGTASGVGISGFTERMRIDSSGNLLVGLTSDTTTPASGLEITPNNGASQIRIGHLTGTATGNYYASFSYSSGIIGSIAQNGTTGVLYNITSDYRLKNNPTPVTNAKDFVMGLQPKTWDWWDGSGKGVGFIAHEFMEVAKYSGHGEKDAVDADGKPVYQTIQPSSSEVMANLVSFIQELNATITDLQAKLKSAGVAGF